MQQVATASGVSKATLYHYVRDKHDLLAQITVGHVARLEALQAEVAARKLPPAEHLRALIEGFMRAYARAGNEHRVLTEDVKFLAEAERGEVLAAQRRVVAGFAASVLALRPELGRGTTRHAAGDAAFRHDQLDFHLAETRRRARSRTAWRRWSPTCSSAAWGR